MVRKQRVLVFVEAMNFVEASVTINGVSLNTAQSMSLRTAVTSWRMQFHGDPEYRKLLGKIGPKYDARLAEIERLLVGQ